MQVPAAAPLDLTYCTNIHPGEGWAEVLQGLRAYAVPLKAALSPEAPFGIGLRLSDQAAQELLEGDALAEAAEFLAAEGLYVALVNGFPFGSFHHARVKDEVFAPDWATDQRLEYTLRLVTILAELMPEGGDGGISTSPLSYKRWFTGDEKPDRAAMLANVVQVAEAMAAVERDTGRLIHLDIEPEPDGLIEDGPEFVAFFENELLPLGGPMLAEALGVPLHEAQRLLRRHVRLCYDTCHFSVQYEEFSAVRAELERVGASIGRIQVSAALRVVLPTDPVARESVGKRLAAFVESTYLHQVAERHADGSIVHHADLGPALEDIHDPDAIEWRVHFHVPLFAPGFGKLQSTRDDIPEALQAALRDGVTSHLEIETYTWDVLPPELKRGLLRSITSEYEWTLAALGLPKAPEEG